MAVPTIQEVFGAAASQTAAALTIQKADLPTLTASATNNGQQLFVAILLKAMGILNPTAQDANPDIKVEISYAGQSVTPGTGGTNSRQDSYTIILYKSVPAEQVDADDY